MAKTKTVISSKATYKRQWRRQNYEDKRFNKLLNQYLQLKHENIFNEYCVFYQTLKEENPNAKDLTKTTAFKKWKKQRKGEQTDTERDEPAKSPVKLVTYIIQDPEVQAEPVTFTEVVQETVNIIHDPEVEAEPVTFTEVAQETVTEGPESVQVDPFIAAVQELFSPAINGEDINIEFNQADNIIAEIINSLEQEDAVRDLLNVQENNQPDQDQDEGIGLNLEDEIEPFDFYREVEFDF